MEVLWTLEVSIALLLEVGMEKTLMASGNFWLCRLGSKGGPWNSIFSETELRDKI